MNLKKEKNTFMQKMLLTKQHLLHKEGKIYSKASLGTKEISKFKPKGRVTIEAIYPNGDKKILLNEEENLVVEQAELIMPYMAIGQRPLTYIELGDPSPASSPELTDIALQQTTGQLKAVTTSITDNDLTLEATWLTSEGNGYNYTEAGLFTSPLGTGLLFARKVFSSITKTSAFSLKFTWVVVFQIASTTSGCSGVAILSPTTLTSDYTYTATGGESELVVPIDFTTGAKQLDVFLNTTRLYYNTHYYESTIGVSKGIKFMSFTLLPGDSLYIVNRSLA